MLNRLARERLESSFPLCWVAGEISNLTYAASGHVYFSLKDSSAQVRCVMFRNKAQLLGWRLENGQHIEARVLVTLYEARGEFQLTVETARKAGLGNLYEQFLRLKEKLENEGLFAEASKRPLPQFPRRIGLITSPQAAALQDVLTTLRRRSPQVSVILYPTPVQCEGATEQIASMLRTASERNECDVLILCRGGGSLEDLWAFNGEMVARAIRASRVPVISGIGHETDFTIADFAADRRAPTPTAAAELAAPQGSSWHDTLGSFRQSMQNSLTRHLAQRAQQLDWLERRLLHPSRQIDQQRVRLDNLRRQLEHGLIQCRQRNLLALTGLGQRLRLARPDTAHYGYQLEAQKKRLTQSGRQTLERLAHELVRLEAALSLLNPTAVLARGYSIVRNEAGQIVRNARELEPNEPIAVFFNSGRADATVTLVTPDDDIAVETA